MKRHMTHLPEVILANGQKWLKLHAPTRWEATPGEVLVGTFIGFQEKTGPSGAYRAVILETDDGNKISITGTMLVSLIECGIEVGDRIRVVYCGTEVSSATQFKYKVFEVYLAANTAVKGKRRSA